MIRNSYRYSSLFTAVLLSLAARSNGAPVYFSYVNTNAGFEQHEGTLPNESSVIWSGPAPFGGSGSLQGFADAGHGSLGGFAHGTIGVPSHFGLGGFNMVADARARFRIDDFVVTPLPGTIPVATVPVSANLHLSGSLLTAANIGEHHIGGADGNASVSVEGDVGGVVFGGQMSNAFHADAYTGVPDSFQSTQTGVLADGAGAFTTPVVNVAVNQPFWIDLTLRAVAIASYGFSGTTSDPKFAFAEAASSFSNTLSFVRSGPAFNVPA